METVRATTGPRESYVALPTGSLKILLALVSSNGIEPETLQRKLNATIQEFRFLVNVLQRQHLVDIVSTLSGDVIRQTLRLTGDGEAVLTGIMERTFELPEYE
jgi:hypothetical protein